MNKIDEIKEDLKIFNATTEANVLYLLSIIEQAEKALNQFTRGNFYLAIENNTWSNYRHMNDTPWTIADEALKSIMGN